MGKQEREGEREMQMSPASAHNRQGMAAVTHLGREKQIVVIHRGDSELPG